MCVAISYQQKWMQKMCWKSADTLVMLAKKQFITTVFTDWINQKFKIFPSKFDRTCWLMITDKSGVK